MSAQGNRFTTHDIKTITVVAVGSNVHIQETTAETNVDMESVIGIEGMFF